MKHTTNTTWGQRLESDLLKEQTAVGLHYKVDKMKNEALKLKIIIKHNKFYSYWHSM